MKTDENNTWKANVNSTIQNCIYQTCTDRVIPRKLNFINMGTVFVMVAVRDIVFYTNKGEYTHMRNVSSNIHTYVCSECVDVKIDRNFSFVNPVVTNAGILGAIRTIVSNKENV